MTLARAGKATFADERDGGGVIAMTLFVARSWQSRSE
jgi:hypothetical protein